MAAGPPELLENLLNPVQLSASAEIVVGGGLRGGRGRGNEIPRLDEFFNVHARQFRRAGLQSRAEDLGGDQRVPCQFNGHEGQILDKGLVGGGYHSPLWIHGRIGSVLYHRHAQRTEANRETPGILAPHETNVPTGHLAQKGRPTRMGGGSGAKGPVGTKEVGLRQKGLLVVPEQKIHERYDFTVVVVHGRGREKDELGALGRIEHLLETAREKFPCLGRILVVPPARPRVDQGLPHDVPQIVGLVDNNELIAKVAAQNVPCLGGPLLGVQSRVDSVREAVNVVRKGNVPHDVVAAFDSLLDFPLDSLLVLFQKSPGQFQIGGSCTARDCIGLGALSLFGRAECETVHVENCPKEALLDCQRSDEKDPVLGIRLEPCFRNLDGGTRLADADAVVQKGRHVGAAGAHQVGHEALDGGRFKGAVVTTGVGPG